LFLAVVTALPVEGDSSAAPPQSAQPAKRVLFAAPLQNGTGQEQYDPVAAGVGEMVAGLLGGQKEITVVERQKFDALAKEQVLTLKGLTGEKFAIAAGKLLEANTVLAGRLYMVDGKPMVNVRALDIATARVIASAELSCRPEDLLEAALDLARKLSGQMSLPLPQIDLTAIDKSPLAGLHYAKALSFYYAGNLDEALMQLMRTIDLDPDYVETYYWSGLCYYRQKEWPHAVIEWQKLLDRAPRSEHAASAAAMLAEARTRTNLTTPPGQPLAPQSDKAAAPKTEVN
jgi:tetratricopeptide (TPR) repeat protein